MIGGLQCLVRDRSSHLANNYQPSGDDRLGVNTTSSSSLITLSKVLTGNLSTFLCSCPATNTKYDDQHKPQTLHLHVKTPSLHTHLLVPAISASPRLETWRWMHPNVATLSNSYVALPQMHPSHDSAPSTGIATCAALAQFQFETGACGDRTSFWERRAVKDLMLQEGTFSKVIHDDRL